MPLPGRPNLAAALVAVLVVVVGTTEATTAESHVRVLGSENFDRLTAKGTWLLEFYAPWCVAVSVCALRGASLCCSLSCGCRPRSLR